MGRAARNAQGVPFESLLTVMEKKQTRRSTTCALLSRASATLADFPAKLYRLFFRSRQDAESGRFLHLCQDPVYPCFEFRGIALIILKKSRNSLISLVHCITYTIAPASPQEGKSLKD